MKTSYSDLKFKKCPESEDPATIIGVKKTKELQTRAVHIFHSHSCLQRQQ